MKKAKEKHAKTLEAGKEELLKEKSAIRLEKKDRKGKRRKCFFFPGKLRPYELRTSSRLILDGKNVDNMFIQILFRGAYKIISQAEQAHKPLQINILYKHQ